VLQYVDLEKKYVFRNFFGMRFSRISNRLRVPLVGSTCIVTFRVNSACCHSTNDSGFSAFLSKGGFGMYAEVFQHHNLSVERLKTLTDTELSNIGVEEVDRLKLRNYLNTAQTQEVELPSTFSEVRATLPADFEHSSTFSNFEKFTLDHLHLELDVNFDESILDGHIECDFTIKENSQFISLDTKELNITSVQNSATGKFLEWKMCDSHLTFGSPLVIQTPSGVKEGDSFKVKINYSTSKGSTAAQFLAPSCTEGKKYPFLFTQCQAIHARSLFPSQDCPAAKCTFTAGVTVPSYMTALVGATRTGSTTVGDRTRYTFKQENLVPSYLVAIAAGEMESRRIGPRSMVWGEPSVVDKAVVDFIETEKFIQIAEKICGPYVWGNYDMVCLPPAFPYGGMENPQLTFLTPTLLAGDRSLAGVVAHEITHSWSGNLVTNSSWNEFWLNEGFTVFIEGKILRDMYGPEMEAIFKVLGRKALKNAVDRYGDDHEYTKLIQNLPETDPDDAFSSVPYKKGAALLYYLEDIVGGSEPMEGFLKAYFSTFANKLVTSQRMKDFFCEYFDGKADLSGIDWDKLFFAPGMPENMKPIESPMLNKCDKLADDMIQIATSKRLISKSVIEDRVPAHALELWYPQVTMILLEKVADEIEQALKAKKISRKQFRDYVNFFGDWLKLDSSKNAEIKFRWLMLALLGGERKKEAAEMASSVGRMKFARPLYRALMKVDLDFAVKTFLENEDFYHPICRKMVKSDLKAAGASI